jgi:hypothetical protein
LIEAFVSPIPLQTHKHYDGTPLLRANLALSMPQEIFGPNRRFGAPIQE